MNTPSMIAGPSAILLQPHDGRYLAYRNLISVDFQTKTFGRQLVVCHHVGATIVVDWQFICAYLGNEHSQHDCRTLHHTLTAPFWQVSCLRSGKISIFFQLSDNCDHQVGSITACRYYNSRCLAFNGVLPRLRVNRLEVSLFH